MKKLCLLIFGFLPLFAFADPVVSNIRASQRENTKLVDILYDVTYSGDSTVSVTCEVSTNSGVSYDVLAEHFSGTGYGVMVTTGVDRVITWNAGIDWDENYSEQMKVRITAEAPRFTDHGDGTVTDNETGLMWTKTMSLDLNGQTTLPYEQVDDVLFGLGDGWRLPLVDEFFTLPQGHPFTGVVGELYWSSTVISFSPDGRDYYLCHYLFSVDGRTISDMDRDDVSASVWAVKDVY